MRQIAWVALAAGFLWTPVALAQDAKAGEGVVKSSGCMKCHSVSAEKDGPSFKSVAAKYKGQADAEQKLTTHVTTSPKIKVGGKEETHPSVKSTDAKEISNLVQWILAQ